MKKILLYFLLMLNVAIAQEVNTNVANNKTNPDKSSIKGKIIDATTGETLPGATVMIEGTTLAASTDLDGRFTIANVPVGRHTLLIKYISFNDKNVEGVEVVAGKPTLVDIPLEPAAKEIKEVEIVGSAKKESVNAMLIMQKNAVTVSDGISAEIIRKTPDKNSSDVLKRVSGTTIQENKFAIIRGLNDRYNAAYINGAPLPSSESDRKAFAFDIFPSALLDNITIIKSASPDLPADFSGGIIQINTRSIPDENSQSISISTGYNTIATFKEFYTYKGGKYDWLGVDDGTRALPKGIPATEEFIKYNPAKQAEVAKLMPNDWALSKVTAKPSLSLQYSLSNVGRLGKNEWGSIAALTYSNDYRINTSVRREFEEQAGLEKPLQTFELNDNQYTNTVLAGALWNLSYKIGQNSKLSLKNMLSINSADKVTVREGNRFNDGNIEQSSVRWYTQNRLYTGQLGGEHYLPSTKLKIKWIGAFSDIARNIPNLRRMVYSKPSASDPSEEPAPFQASIPISGTSISSGGNIFYSNTLESIYSGNCDVSFPLSFLPFKTEIKVGGMHQQRLRDFSARQLGFSRYNVFGGNVQFDNTLLLLPEDQIFAPQNLGLMESGKGGFKLSEATKLNDTYHALSILHAGYLMLDNKFTEKLRLIWGARLEAFRQKLESFEDDGAPVAVNTEKTDVLPSANLIWSVNELSNLRFSYAQTLCRPEFRELAPFGFFDFVTFFVVRGNPELKRALVHNADVRYEWFPGMGQIVSASVFYKRYTDAIEQVNRADVPRELYFQNVPLVNNYGLELEYRLNLGNIFNFDQQHFLSSTYLYSNLALIKSEVDVSKIPGALSAKRPLQGQSPYVLNAGIQYNNPEKNYGFSFVLNRIGRRIAIVGNIQEPDIYEQGRTVMDVQFSKTFFKKLDVKLTLKDMLAQNLVFYQDINGNKKLDIAADNLMSETRNGRTFGISLSYKIN